MPVIFVKHSQSNSCNEDENIEWRMFDKEDDVKAWEAEIKGATEQWNYRTPGVNSVRYSSVTEYSVAMITEATLDDLVDMPMLMFLKAQELVKALL